MGSGVGGDLEVDVTVDSEIGLKSVCVWSFTERRVGAVAEAKWALFLVGRDAVNLVARIVLLGFLTAASRERPRRKIDGDASIRSVELARISTAAIARAPDEEGR